MTNTAPEFIVTDHGAKLKPGDRAYNYYDMKPGRIPDGSGGADFSYYDRDREVNPGRDIWFRFVHDDGSVALLNGERICTLEFAGWRGFKDAA